MAKKLFTGKISSFVYLVATLGNLAYCFNIEPRVILEFRLWKKGDLGVNTYRIPIIASMPDGSLIALSEARKHSSSDSGPKFLAMRRSTTAGESWTPTRFIVDDREASDGLNLGTVIVDEIKKTVFVMYSWCYHKCKYPTTYLIRSDDYGLNWTKPVNISQQIRGLRFAPGPGFGIQKNVSPWKGRLITCGHSVVGHDGIFCAVSDDNGESWRIAGTLPAEAGLDPNESQIIEQSDGILLVTSRNQNHYKCHCRIMARSYDGAESFAHSDVYYDETLVDPICAAGLLNYKNVVFFSNPANQMLRVNMTVRWSLDSAETWRGALQVWKGASGYSCLTAVPTSAANESYIGLVFEKGSLRYDESIVFVKIQF